MRGLTLYLKCSSVCLIVWQNGDILLQPCLWIFKSRTHLGYKSRCKTRCIQRKCRLVVPTPTVPVPGWEIAYPYPYPYPWARTCTPYPYPWLVDMLDPYPYPYPWSRTHTQSHIHSANKKSKKIIILLSWCYTQFLTLFLYMLLGKGGWKIRDWNMTKFPNTHPTSFSFNMT